MTRTRSLVVLVPLLALGLTACGQGDRAPATSTPSMSHSMTAPATSATSTTATTRAVGALISISDFEFTVSGPVARGSTVTVRNGDAEAHTVTSKAGGFDVKVDPGATVTFTAPDTAGRYAFACSFHAEMTGDLVVD